MDLTGTINSLQEEIQELRKSLTKVQNNYDSKKDEYDAILKQKNKLEESLNEKSEAKTIIDNEANKKLQLKIDNLEHQLEDEQKQSTRKLAASVENAIEEGKLTLQNKEALFSSQLKKSENLYKQEQERNEILEKELNESLAKLDELTRATLQLESE